MLSGASVGCGDAVMSVGVVKSSAAAVKVGEGVVNWSCVIFDGVAGIAVAGSGKLHADIHSNAAGSRKVLMNLRRTVAWQIDPEQ
jgi:hypothetical protein